MKRVGFCFIFLLCAAMAPTAHAETLDDASIHKIYDQIDAARNDPAETAKLIKERAADNYIATAETTYHLHGDIKKKSTTRNKDQVLLDAVHPRDADIENYHHEITSITYSNDRKFAYVKDTMSMTLIMKTPANTQDTPVIYTQTVSGSQTLSLIDGRIQALKNERQIDATLNEK